MLVTESRSLRRLVGRLDRGMSLFDAVLEVCREHRVRTAELRALGSFETVEVAEYDQAQKSWKAARSFSGGMEIVGLTGNVSERAGNLSFHCHASLMRERDNGVEILGGHLVSARVFALEFVLEVFDDLILRRGMDPATGLTLWTEALTLPGQSSAPTAAQTEDAEDAHLPSPTQPSSPLPSASSIRSAATASWSDVAAASARRSSDSTVENGEEGAVDDDTLEAGDVLIHPTFGRCDVQRIEGGYEFAHVRLKNGRLVRLSLEILKVVPAGSEGGKRIYRARID